MTWVNIKNISSLLLYSLKKYSASEMQPVQPELGINELY